MKKVFYQRHRTGKSKGVRSIAAGEGQIVQFHLKLQRTDISVKASGLQTVPVVFTGNCRKLFYINLTNFLKSKASQKKDLPFSEKENLLLDRYDLFQITFFCMPHKNSIFFHGITNILEGSLHLNTLITNNFPFGDRMNQISGNTMISAIRFSAFSYQHITEQWLLGIIRFCSSGHNPSS